MNCPKCNGGHSVIMRTLHNELSVDRTRRCSTCGHEFKTVESTVTITIQGVSEDGSVLCSKDIPTEAIMKK